jgi:tetratricopeptide (TPR) repeat protein
MVMGIARIGWNSVLAGSVVLTLALVAAPARAADDAALRERALALNDVTGDGPIKGEIKKLLSDPKGTKKLLEVAVRMTKEKEQPFSYNGALILADVAFVLRDYDASYAFFRVCADQALSLQSSQKLVKAWLGIDNVGRALYRERKYDKSAKLAQEFLESLERRGASDVFKGEVLRLEIQSMKKQGKGDQARRMIQTLRKARPNDWRAMKLEGWFEAEDKHYPEAIKLYQDAVERINKDEGLRKEEKAEDLAETREEIVDLLYRAKKYDECAKQGLQFLGSAGEDQDAPRRRFAMLQRVTAALGKLKKFQEAQAAIEAEKKRDKDGKDGERWELEDLKARVYREADQFKESAKIYEELVAKIGKDDKLSAEQKEALQSEIRYFLSGIYVDMNQVDKAAKELQSLLAKHPDNPTYNNDLGYIWADHDQNLDQAEKMIRKAIEEDRKQRQGNSGADSDQNKDNAAYLDSLGWVLYKKKQYAEAKKHLLEAVKDADGQHIEIMDHLGDIYKALGDKKEAVATWKKALDLKQDTETKRDRDRRVEVEKKIKSN